MTRAAPSPVAPHPPTEVARRNSALLRFIGKGALRVAGWRIVGELPREPRLVIIVAPHTSNWDFVIGVFGMFALDLRIDWLGKDTLFSTPLGPLLRRLGGRPVKRGSSEGAVAEITTMLRAAPRFILALAPEGTRRPVRQWRTGFYHIAESLRVPIVPVWLDWKRREIGLGTLLLPTGALAADVAKLQQCYRAEMGRYPGGYGIG